MTGRQSVVDYARVFAAAPTPYLLISPEFTILDANHAYLSATGRRRDELLGKHLFEAFPQAPGDSSDGLPNLRTSLERVRGTGEPDMMAVQRYDIPVWGTDEFTERYWSPVNVPILDDEGRTMLLLHRVEDVTDFVRERERRQVERQRGESYRRRVLEAEAHLFARIRELQNLNDELRITRDLLAAAAVRDPLTGLLVRAVFLEELSRALARLARHPHPVAVLFIDVDRLKPINDSYGHAAGDELIRSCAERVSASVRPSDPVARIGGDEFVVLLTDLTDASEIPAITARILADLGAPCHLAAGPLIRPSVSIGGAVTEDSHMDADTLVARADAAMYGAKQSGGGRYVLFDEQEHGPARAGHLLEAELRAALSTDQLTVYYQPIIDLTTGAVDGVEALLRWDHPTRGLLPARQFITVAEDSGLIAELGVWVRQQACGQLAEWDATLSDRAPRRLFLNLSPLELQQTRLDEHVNALATRAGIHPQRIVLEIPEAGFANGAPIDAGVVDVLLESGCELAIEDFGSGRSSLGYLMKFPAGVFKVDRASGDGLHDDREWAAMVSAVLLLAHNLGKTVVVEGVEDAATLSLLTDLECHYVQGFHVARPQSAESLGRRFREPVIP